jgi:hypothetical protein
MQTPTHTNPRLYWSLTPCNYKDHRNENGFYERYKRNDRCAVCTRRISKDARERNPSYNNTYLVRWRKENHYRSKLINYRAKYKQEPSRPPPKSCECCGIEDNNLQFDHCHNTNQFRGWLCGGCNKALGQINDSIERAKQLVKYLERNQNENSVKTTD